MMINPVDDSYVACVSPTVSRRRISAFYTLIGAGNLVKNGKSGKT